VKSANHFAGPLFLVGMPRSGTKLLREILLQHGQVAIPRVETEFLPELVRYIEVRGGTVANRQDFERLYQWVRAFPYFRYCAEQGELITAQRWWDFCKDRSAAGIFEALVRHDAGAPSGSEGMGGDKSPSYITCIWKLAAWFPHGRIIHIVRDVRDHVASVRDAWGKDLLRAAQRWNDDTLAAAGQGAHLAWRFKTVRYEDLVLDPETQVARLCEFLDIDFRRSMLSWSRSPENIGDARGATSVVRSGVARYESRLTKQELRAIESIAAGAMETFGYVPVFRVGRSRVSPIGMKLRALKDGFSLVRSRSGSSGWRGAARFYANYWRATHGRGRR
jgi:hypothetical protein